MLLKRIDEVERLWAVMLPHVQPPERPWVGRWCTQPVRVVEHAIVRASKKFPATPAPIESEIVWRYVSGTISSEVRQRGQHESR